MRSGVICAGHWIVDLVHDIEHWPRESDLVRISSESRGIGGGAANVASALARFKAGLEIWPVGAIGDDDYGAFVERECSRLSLSTDYLVSKPGAATGHTHVMSVSGQSRTFFYHGGGNDLFCAEDVSERLLNDAAAKIFYIGYPVLLASLDKVHPDGSTQAGALLARARASGHLTCADLVSADRPDFADCVRSMLPHLDVLVLNEIEAARATERPLPQPGEEPSDDVLSAMAAELLASGVNRAVVIHCPQKALWCDRNGSAIWARAEFLQPGQIVSLVGAGDAFCTGLIYGLHENWVPARCLALAHATARASLKGATCAEAIPTLADLLDSL
ncbi:MAG: carbohydrate kinase family protein [Pseudomonadota bacterium]